MRISRVLVGVTAVSLIAAGCGSESPPPESTTTAPGDAASATIGTAGYLSSVCPETIKIQLQWYPQPDPYGMIFGLLADGDLDTAAASYSGTAKADPNQNIEIVGGGPLIGYQQVNAQMYSDPDILLGDVSLDQAASAMKNFPTVSVIAPFEKSPQSLMFDPEKRNFASLEQIKDSNATVLVPPNSIYVDALVQQGKLNESQIDSTFDFGPSRFVADSDNLVQAGFTTNEPYIYENSSFWNKPVGDVLLADSGYPNYQNNFVVTPEKLQSESDCLGRLVPLMQQSMIDYFNQPDEINELIAKLTTDLNSPSPTTAESAAFADSAMRSQGLVANVPGSATFGAHDMNRVQQMITILAPVFEDDTSFDSSITPGQLATNEFIDPRIGFAQ